MSLQRVLDVALALVVTAVGLAELWVPFTSRTGDGSPVLGTVLVAGTGLALSLRRTFPLAAGLVVLWGWPVVFLVGPVHVLFFGQFVPMMIALFSMARSRGHRMPAYAAGAAALTLLFFDLFVQELQSPGEIVFHWGVAAVTWSFGYGLRTAEQRTEASLRRAVDAEVAAAEAAMTAVLDERTRIARELHDIVAHTVSSIVVQAGAAEQVVDDDPGYVREALRSIRTTGAGALDDMRRVVAVLRDGEDADHGLRPQPGLDGVATLVEEARASGLAADLAVDGVRPEMPPGMELAAYRIVQEALTNVRRHSAARSVQVRLAYRPDALRIEVTDDGPARPAATGSGHGLVGMRERAAVYGGWLEAGAAAAGRGFCVRAELPVRVAT